MVLEMLRGGGSSSRLRKFDFRIHPEHVRWRVWEACWQTNQKVRELMIESRWEAVALNYQVGHSLFGKHLKVKALAFQPTMIVFAQHAF